MSGELERAHMRISDADRERVVDQLQVAAGEGRLSLDEFAERLDVLYAAKTFGDLAPLTADLPDTGTEMAPSQDEFAPHSSSLRRNGRWLVPRHVSLRPRTSSVKLDFTDAVLPHRDVDISLEASASSVTLLIPAGANVDERIDPTASSVVNRVPFDGEARWRFLVRGSAKASSVKIRRRRRFLWWTY